MDGTTLAGAAFETIIFNRSTKQYFEYAVNSQQNTRTPCTRTRNTCTRTPTPTPTPTRTTTYL